MSKIIGETYKLKEFEVGDIGAFVRGPDHEGERFLVVELERDRCWIQSVANRIPQPCTFDTLYPARFLGKGQIVPAKIEVFPESSALYALHLYDLWDAMSKDREAFGPKYQAFQRFIDAKNKALKHEEDI